MTSDKEPKSPFPPHFPHLWYKQLQEKENWHEDERVRVTCAVDEALNELKKKYQWEKLYLFGSLVKRGKFRTGSDVDIAVEGLDKFSLYAFIGDLSLLLMRNVDVVRFEECSFADHIKKNGIKWTPKKR